MNVFGGRTLITLACKYKPSNSSEFTRPEIYCYFFRVCKGSACRDDGPKSPAGSLSSDVRSPSPNDFQISKLKTTVIESNQNKI